jgi:hypothetical protein
MLAVLPVPPVCLRHRPVGLGLRVARTRRLAQAAVNPAVEAAREVRLTKVSSLAQAVERTAHKADKLERVVARPVVQPRVLVRIAHRAVERPVQSAERMGLAPVPAQMAEFPAATVRQAVPLAVRKVERQPDRLELRDRLELEQPALVRMLAAECQAATVRLVARVEVRMAPTQDRPAAAER